MGPFYLLFLWINMLFNQSCMLEFFLSYYSHDPCVILNTSQLSTHATFISWKLFPDYRVQSKDQILKVAQVKLQDSRLLFFRTDSRWQQIAWKKHPWYHTSDRGEVYETLKHLVPYLFNAKLSVSKEKEHKFLWHVQIRILFSVIFTSEREGKQRLFFDGNMLDYNFQSTLQ